MTISSDELKELLAKATDGPWLIETETKGYEVCTIHGVPAQPTEDGKVQAWVYVRPNRLTDDDGWYWPTDEGQFANAQLVALAPQLAADNIALQAEVERWRINSIDTWSAMNTMRNSINEHVPMPSVDSDLLQGPENSVFCTSVAESVIVRVTELEAENAKLREALEEIASGDGVYGAQAHEYKTLARAALND